MKKLLQTQYIQSVGRLDFEPRQKNIQQEQHLDYLVAPIGDPLDMPTTHADELEFLNHKQPLHF